MADGTVNQREWKLTRSNYKRGLVRHIVLLRYHKHVDESDLHHIEQRFHELQTSMRDGRPYILDIESGTQNSPENLGQGYQQAYIVSFASQGDRNYYVGKPFITDPALYDPMHHAFKSFITAFVSHEPNSVVVFDFSADRLPSRNNQHS